MIRSPAPVSEQDPFEARKVSDAALLENVAAALWESEALFSDPQKRARAYRSPAFAFAKKLRELDPALTQAADLAHEAVTPCLAAIAAERGLTEGNPWRALLPSSDSLGNPADPEADFLALWTTLRPSPLPIALARADRERWTDPAAFGEELSRPVRGSFRRFLAFCAELSKINAENGSDSIFLPRAKVAELFGVDTRTVTSWFRDAKARGFLDLISPGRQAGAGRRASAACYRWRGPMP